MKEPNAMSFHVKYKPEDFMPVFDFNTPATVGVLGTAVSEISQRLLRQIEVTI